MSGNRSVPSDALVGHVFYRDVEQAISWLTSTLGFDEQFRYGSPVQGAQLVLGKACVMVASARTGRESPRALGGMTQMLTVIVPDIDALFRRVGDREGRVVEAPYETPYGEQQFVVEDPEGHHWLISRHCRDVAPEEWGASLTHAG